MGGGAGGVGRARDRLAEFLLDQVTSLVPGGFEAYARVLHPAVAGSEAAGDERPCRWSEAAAWSGLPLGPSSTVAEVFTRRGATGEIEWFPGGPRIADDALALGDIEYQWRSGLDLPGVCDEVADLWWPESRAWFVGADTDLYSTYIGGSRATIGRLLDDPRLEVLPMAPTDRLA